MTRYLGIREKQGENKTVGTENDRGFFFLFLLNLIGNGFIIPFVLQ